MVFDTSLGSIAQIRNSNGAGGRRMTLAGTINLGANELQICGANSSNTVLTNVISGNGGALSFGGSSHSPGAAMTISGTNNSYDGPTTFQAGSVTVSTLANVGGGSSSLGAPATASNGTIRLGSGAYGVNLVFTPTTDFATNRVISLASTSGGSSIYSNGAGSVALNGDIVASGAGSKTLTLAGTNTGENTVSGEIADYSSSYVTSVAKSGLGAWAITGNNSYTGATSISSGKLILAGCLMSDIIVTGGTFAPRGAPYSTEDLSINNGGVFQVVINGTAPGEQYDQLVIGGSATLSGALDIVAGAGLSPGMQFTILSAGSISGIFAEKATGTLFTTNGYSWLINYSGGAGSDIVLSVASGLDRWRWSRFGTTLNFGTASDSADPDNDGETNFFEYATDQGPKAKTRSQGTLVRNGASLEYTYTRSKAARADGVTFTVQWSDTLAPGDWSTAGIVDQNPAPIFQDANVETLQIVIPSGSNKRFVRLEVSQP